MAWFGPFTRPYRPDRFLGKRPTADIMTKIQARDPSPSSKHILCLFVASVRPYTIL